MPIAVSRAVKSETRRWGGGVCWNARWVSGVIFAICASVLLLAAFLEPDSSGLGTHTKLGLPKCSVYASAGVPCTTCGMTTAFAHAAEGHVIQAFVTQPFGAVLALLTAMLVLVSGYATIVGISLAPLGRLFARPAVFWCGAILLIAAWAYKVLVMGDVIDGL